MHPQIVAASRRVLSGLSSARALTWVLPLGLSALAVAQQTRLLRHAQRHGRLLAGAATAFEARPVQARCRVLLLGDSTGVGVGARDPRETLPSLLAGAYPGVRIVNRCHNGARVADVLRQAQRLGEFGAPFDVVLLLVGGNDVLKLTPHAQLRHDAQALLRALCGHARHVAWLGSANVGHAPVLKPPLSWLASWRTARTMRLLAGAAAAHGVPFIDFSRDDRFASDTATYFAADGMHPSSASYRLCFNELARRVPLHEWLSAGKANESTARTQARTANGRHPIVVLEERQTALPCGGCNAAAARRCTRSTASQRPSDSRRDASSCC